MDNLAKIDDRSLAPVDLCTSASPSRSLENLQGAHSFRITKVWHI